MATVIPLVALLVTLQVVWGRTGSFEDYHKGYGGYGGYGKSGGYHIPNYALPYLSGHRGRSGRDGEKGEKGEKGMMGERGAPGANSTVRGPQGEPGYDGEPGEPGMNGTMGDRGMDGVMGLQGRNGTGAASMGTTYVNWGQNSCPSPSELIYSGFVVSPAYNNAGGGAQYVCMDINNLDNGDVTINTTSNPLSTLVQVRFETFASSSDFPFNDPNHQEPLHDYDGNTVACAVCLNNGTDVVTIPNNNECPTAGSGYTWNMEYTGYLMAARDFISNTDVGLSQGPVFLKSPTDPETHFRTEYICVNGMPTDTEDTPSPEPSNGDGLLAHTRIFCSDLTGLLSTGCDAFYDLHSAERCVIGAENMGHCANGPLSCTVCSLQVMG